MASRGHVLIVDDERAIRRLLRMYLSDAGFTVAEAADGEAAIEQVRRGGIDLVLLDLMLPEMDGFDGRPPATRDRARPGDHGHGAQRRDPPRNRPRAGADDYVVKPFSPAEVVARVKAVMRRVRAPPDPTGCCAPGRWRSSPRAGG